MRSGRCAFGVSAGLTPLCLLTAPGLARAQAITFDLAELGQGADGSFTLRLLQLFALVTVISLAPSILIMVTSFTRVVVVLSLLRSAIGTATAPPNSVLVALALFLTFYIMSPTFESAYRQGIEPLVEAEIGWDEAFTRTAMPFRDFMLAQAREEDLQLFVSLSDVDRSQSPDELALSVLVPAFMISELRRAFEIGFLLYLPFIIIDLMVAALLMSMGMIMLPPVVISLPIKLIFFVLADGWHMIAGSLVKSFYGA